MAVDTTNAPELTAEQVARILTKPLEAASTFLASGPRVFDTAGPLRIPSLGQMVDELGEPEGPDWIGESEQITERDVDFGEVSLMPSTMKSVKVITRFSNELARQSVVALDAALQQRLVTDVAAKLDAQFWSDTGDGITTPRGILAYPGTQTRPALENEEWTDVLTDAWGMALGANVNVSALRWVMRPETFVMLRKVKESGTSQRPLLQPDFTQDALFRILGSPVTITSRLPKDGTDKARIVLADFSQIAVARDLAPSVTVLRERYADFDEQALRVVARYDAAPLNPEAVVKITGV